jgi:2-polyprenyl-3-methyl-5-hydroxy-6-metoxy-1,4-benzoquinol methylase
MLDIGCGKGFFLEYMKKFYSVMGTDISMFAVNRSKELLENVPLFLADATHLCFKKEKFDIVTAFDIIEHIQDPEPILKEFYSVLRLDGILVITTPNMKSIGRKLKKDNWFGYRDKTHISLLYPDEWIKLIEDSGFKVSNIYFDGLWDSPYFTKIPSFLQHIVFKYFSTILLCFGVTFPQKYGEDLYVIARKV